MLSYIMEKYKFEAAMLRIMRIVICLSALLIGLYACSGEKRNFTLEVKVDDTDNTMLYLAQRTLTGTVPVDSAWPDKSGRYKLQGFTRQPDFYILYQQPRQYINLIIHPGDRFSVMTKAVSFDRNYLVEGSSDSRLIQKMVNMQTITLEKITEISLELENSRGAADYDRIKARIDRTYDQIVAEHREFSIRLIAENPGSLAGLMALYQQLGRNAPVFDYRKDFIYYARVDSALAPLYPRSEAVIDLNRKVAELRELLRLETGAPAPDINLPDLNGRNIALSSLKGKKVLLVFWASWSSQSLAEWKRLQNLYPKIAGADLEYYQVSLDRTRDSWQSALAGKETAGIHVSDMLYWDSPVVSLYRIEQLPVIYLISETGMILGRDISADDLPRLLQEE